MYVSVFIHNYLGSDCPALRDIANLIVPDVCHKWYDLGLQLLDSEDVPFLQSLKTEYQCNSDRCREVFIHWLNVTENPTWSKILKALDQKSVKLPNVAANIRKMLKHRVSIRIRILM